MNCSYASKPGHLLFTAYVSMLMWLFSRASLQTHLFQGRSSSVITIQDSRGCRLGPQLRTRRYVLRVRSRRSTQYYNMSRLPLCDTAPVVLQSHAHSFSSRTHRSNLRSFVSATRRKKYSWFFVYSFPFDKRTL